MEISPDKWDEQVSRKGETIVDRAGNERLVESKDGLLEDFASNQPILFDICQLVIEVRKSRHDLFELLSYGKDLPHRTKHVPHPHRHRWLEYPEAVR